MRRRLISIILVLAMIGLVVLPKASLADEVTAPTEVAESPAQDVNAVETARPSVNGRLHVEGTQLVDQEGRPVQLRGVSTHGLTWYPEFINQSLFDQVSIDWNGNFIRLAMYSEVYCGEDQEQSLELMRKGIDAAIEADMYVLVDWHILEDSDPNQNIDAALDFFETISSEYASYPNLLFEICNEPNGKTDWTDVVKYSNIVIPAIRKNIPDAVIVVGTPEYDRNLGSAVLRPLDFDNVMYVLHFYAATHKEGLREELATALDAGLPVFISECGVCESSGDGVIDFESAAEWFSFLNEHKLSYAVWSLSDKDETSAMFNPGFDPTGTIRNSDLTTTGTWVRELIRNEDPKSIPTPAGVIEKSRSDDILSWISNSLGDDGYVATRAWPRYAAAAVGFVLLMQLILTLYARKGATPRTPTYDDLFRGDAAGPQRAIGGKTRTVAKVTLTLSMLFTIIYLGWRIGFSIPVEAGPAAVATNVILLAVEVLGFIESQVLFWHLLGMKTHPLPQIPDEAYPDVDVFIATYNEPTDLLRRTINGCKHMRYPDPSRVHIWICDDNRRPQMRALAEEMGVGYFDRPDNKGAKAGNLNHALGLTQAPYVVTFDADMIPKSDFLLKTIPYFVDAERRNQDLPPEMQRRLGLLQTPQSFYDPDVFQFALYSETRAPNEQNFFYRTIEPAKTCTNSVIYGGSNTVIARAALEAIGGFYTESITEDFATGILIESNGFVSLGLPEPLANGQTPHTFREHIQQRSRWGRGVIATARQLKVGSIPGLTLAQKISYWSSVVYWFSPIKNFIYILSPLLFAVFAVPVFKCNWLDLAVYWLPMFVMQDVALRVSSQGSISHKWSGIYETSVMAHLFFPIVQEALGIHLATFKVTDKSKRDGTRQTDYRAMAPFIVLVALSLAGIIRILSIFSYMQAISLLILTYWIIRNLYFLTLSLFLIDGRDGDTEPVHVTDALLVQVDTIHGERRSYEGVTTQMTEHTVTVFLDDGETLGIGDSVRVSISDGKYQVDVEGCVTSVNEARRSNARTHTIEILNYGDEKYEYWQVLYDRVPTLPQSLHRDFGLMTHLWQNIAHRVARTRKR